MSIARPLQDTYDAKTAEESILLLLTTVNSDNHDPRHFYAQNQKVAPGFESGRYTDHVDYDD
jgi:hypothetical protein